VTLLVVDSEGRAGRHGEEPGADIALYLARHGARVDVEQVLSKGTPVAEIILSHAADHGMDLIVIGAYSHARFVEMMFGGVNAETGACSAADVTVSELPPESGAG
jgi:nucleotide-binding universal stress UspA family protein